jgi:short-subunit dehydrogenase
MKRLQDRVAVVTGAGSGIGQATATALAAAGCHLALVDIAEPSLDTTAKSVRSLGRNASLHVLDVREREGFGPLVDEVVSAHGHCNILVNNAGVTSAGPFEAEPLEDLQWIVDINLWGVVNGCRAFLPVLHEADEAHIVNMSSMVALLGLPQNAAYALTKGAVRSFTEALRNELAPTNIGVTAVFPGAINTNITQSARGSQSGRLADMGRSRLAPLVMRPPSAVASRIVNAIERDRGRVVVGPDAHLVSAWSRVAPGRARLLGRLLAKV